MNIVIVGGGMLSYYLIKTLSNSMHKVTLVEKDLQVCHRMANQLGIEVVHGDGSTIEQLERCAKKADVFIASTGRDEDNLIACQLAKRNFGVRRTISKVNNPKNVDIFEKLGVDYPISSTTIIAQLIEQEIDFSSTKTLMRLKSGKVIMMEFTIEPDALIINRMVKDLTLPPACVFVSIIRGSKVLIPNGFTVLKQEDCVIVMVSEPSVKALQEMFG
jgi:trk system potassium uptake protein